MKVVSMKRWIVTVLVALFINAMTVGVSFAQSLASLKGTWVITLAGQTGAGNTVYQVIATLDKNGTTTSSSNAVVNSSSEVDGIGLSPYSEKFSIDSATWDAKKRTGKAKLTGGNQAWDFSDLTIQVSKDGQMFNVIWATNPGQRLVGTGVKQ